MKDHFVVKHTLTGPMDGCQSMFFARAVWFACPPTRSVAHISPGRGPSLSSESQAVHVLLPPRGLVRDPVRESGSANPPAGPLIRLSVRPPACPFTRPPARMPSAGVHKADCLCSPCCPCRTKKAARFQQRKKSRLW